MPMKPNLCKQDCAAAVAPSTAGSSIRLAAMCWMVAVISFGGFCFENAFVALTLGYIDNKNMVLPFLLGYGLAVVALYLVFGTPTEPRFFRKELSCKNTVLKLAYYFSAVFLCISVGEIVIGVFVERVCDVTWWDYSGIPLHVTKFTSVPTGIGFTLPIMLLMHFCFEPLCRRFERLPKKVLYPVAAVSMVLLFADCIFSGVRMYLTHDFLIIWRIDL